MIGSALIILDQCS